MLPNSETPSRTSITLYLRSPWAMRVGSGILIAGLVGVEYGVAFALYYFLFIDTFGSKDLFLTGAIVGGVFGIVVGAIGGALWGREVRAVLGSVVMGMGGGFLGLLASWWFLPALKHVLQVQDRDDSYYPTPEKWPVLVGAMLGTILGGLNTLFKRRKLRAPEQASEREPVRDSTSRR